MVAKLIKPYVRTGLPEELEIMEALIDLVDDHFAFYRLEDVPVRQLFEQIRDKLEEELLVTQEQEHFKRAYQYYAGSKAVTVPKILPMSTEDVTFMEFLHGEKITDSFPGDTGRRAILARRLAHTMSFDALFSKTPTSVFHGDPHAGNVMHITDDPANRYRIGLIDWGLLGNFEREERLQMFHLTLALRWKEPRRFRRNVGSLLAGGLPEDPAKRKEIFALADMFLNRNQEPFEALAELIGELTKRGYILAPDLTLYIKSQLTLKGIYAELDPKFDLMKYLEGRVARQVFREAPKRLLFFPAFKHRGYRSLMSTGEALKGAVRQ
jgi:ubiquinone biosynthesis protein